MGHLLLSIRKRMEFCHYCQHVLKLGNITLQGVSEEKKTESQAGDEAHLVDCFPNMNKSQYSFHTIT